MSSPRGNAFSSSEFVRLIVHPLFANMPEPDSSARKPRSTDLQPKKFRPSSPKGMDPATSIVDLGKDFADIILMPSSTKKTLKSARGLPVEMILAGLSLGFFIAGVERAPRIKLEHVPDIDPQDLLETWLAWKATATSPAALGQIAKRGNDFSWLHLDNSTQCNLERLAAAATTMAYAWALLRQKGGLPSKSDQLKGTALIDITLAKGEPERIEGPPIILQQKSEDPLVIAAEEVRKGHRVAVLCSASAFQVGGAFLTGGCHFLEEAMCMQSTLFNSLQKAACIAEDKQLKDAFGRPVHVPEYGAVLSPSVDVFRSNGDAGYAPAKPFELAAVLSLSLPNRNPKLDVPLDNRTGEDYDKLIEQKFRAAFMGAVSVGARVLVIPKMGCGELENLPSDIGRALGREMFYWTGRFDTVIIAGSTELFESARTFYEANLPNAAPTQQAHVLALKDTAVARKEDGLPNTGCAGNLALLTGCAAGWAAKYHLATEFDTKAPTSARQLSAELKSKALEEHSKRKAYGWLALLTSCAANKVGPNGNATGSNPRRSECARQLGTELKLKALEEHSKNKAPPSSELFEKYGMSNGKIPSWKLRSCMTEFYGGEVPTDEELQFLTRSSDPTANQRLIPVEELQEALRAWELYKEFNKDIELVFYLYDDAASGKLEESQVIHILQEMTTDSGEPLTLEQVMTIMRRADVGYDGLMSRFDFAVMIVKWQALEPVTVEEKAIKETEPLCLRMDTFPWVKIRCQLAVCETVPCQVMSRVCFCSLQDKDSADFKDDGLKGSADFKRQFLV